MSDFEGKMNAALRLRIVKGRLADGFGNEIAHAGSHAIILNPEYIDVIFSALQREAWRQGVLEKYRRWKLLKRAAIKAKSDMPKDEYNRIVDSWDYTHQALFALLEEADQEDRKGQEAES